jgi:hypothetical protein
MAMLIGERDEPGRMKDEKAEVKHKEQKAEGQELFILPPSSLPLALH